MLNSDNDDMKVATRALVENSPLRILDQACTQGRLSVNNLCAMDGVSDIWSKMKHTYTYAQSFNFTGKPADLMSLQLCTEIPP